MQQIIKPNVSLKILPRTRYIIASVLYILLILWSVVTAHYLNSQTGVKAINFISVSITQIILGTIILFLIMPSFKAMLNTFWHTSNVKVSMISLGLTFIIFTILYLYLMKVDFFTIVNNIQIGQFVYFCLLIGLSEELLFRFLPMQVFSKYRSSIVIIIISLVFVFYHYNVSFPQIVYFMSFALLMFNLKYHSVPILGLALIHGWHNTLVSATPVDFLQVNSVVYSYTMSLFFVTIICLSNWIISSLQRRAVLKAL